MGQYEIIKCLEDSDRPLSIKEIIEIIGDSRSNTSKCIRSLLKYNEIFFEELDRINAARYLSNDRITRRIRFFYINNNQKKVILQFLQ